MGNAKASRAPSGDRLETAFAYGKRTSPPRSCLALRIVDEVKASRGSPHGGVFLDIAWIKEKMPNAAEQIKKKLLSMYHQFMQLANLDITKVPMEVGPMTHYIMGGARVDAETQMSNVPGLFARAKWPPDCTGRTGWAEIHCRTCSCSASARANSP